MKRRRLVLFLLVGAGATAWACGFPDVTFGPDGGGVTPPPNNPSDAQNDNQVGEPFDGAIDVAQVPPPPDVDPNFDPDASHDAATREGGPERPEAGVDASGTVCGGFGSNACNCDDDPSINSSPACSGQLGSNPPDCDDFDPLVHPGQDFVSAKWDPRSPHTPAGDWNCDKSVTKQYPYNVPCTSLDNCGEGFAGDPACGESATYNHCQVYKLLGLLGLACQVIPGDAGTEIRTQGCK